MMPTARYAIQAAYFSVCVSLSFFFIREMAKASAVGEFDFIATFMALFLLMLSLHTIGEGKTKNGIQSRKRNRD